MDKKPLKQAKHPEHTPLNLGMASFSVILVLAVSIFAMATQEQRIDELNASIIKLKLTQQQQLAAVEDQSLNDQANTAAINALYMSSVAGNIPTNTPEKALKIVTLAHNEQAHQEGDLEWFVDPDGKNTLNSFVIPDLTTSTFEAVPIQILNTVESPDKKSAIYLIGNPRWLSGGKVYAGYFVMRNGLLAGQDLAENTWMYAYGKQEYPDGLTSAKWLSNSKFQMNYLKSSAEQVQL